MNKIKSKNIKGEGINKKTLKKIGKYGLAGLVTLGTVANILQGNQDRQYNKYIEGLGGYGIGQDLKKYEDKIRKLVKKHGKKVALGALGSYAVYKGLNYPFIPVGGSGIKEKIKQVSKYALPIAGTIGAAYFLDKYIGNMPVKYTPPEIVENLGAYYPINVPSWVEEVHSQLPLYGSGINLEKRALDVPQIRKNDRINKSTTSKYLKYAGYAIPAAVLAYAAYKTDIVPKIYNNVSNILNNKDVNKKLGEGALEFTAEEASEVAQLTAQMTGFDEALINQIEGEIPLNMDYMVDRLEKLRDLDLDWSNVYEQGAKNKKLFEEFQDIEFDNFIGQVPDLSEVGTQTLRNVSEIATQTPESRLAEMAQTNIAKAYSLIKNDISDISKATKDTLINIAEKYGVDYEGLNKPDLKDLLISTLRGKLKEQDKILLKTVETTRELAMDRPKGYGLKKKQKKGKGLFFGMKNVEKYKNIIN